MLAEKRNVIGPPVGIILVAAWKRPYISAACWKNVLCLSFRPKWEFCS